MSIDINKWKKFIDGEEDYSIECGISNLKKYKEPSKERGCKNKIDLGNNFHKTADKLSLKHRKQYGVYLCPYCNGTHLTTKIENQMMYKPLLYITGLPS